METKTLQDVEQRIIELRGQKVIIDSDVALLYGVETRDVNKAVKNNLEKFPEGFIIELTIKEKQELVENLHHLQSLKFSPVRPKAFTERGLYMLATILKSEKATQTTLNIINTFAKLRELTRTISEISNTNDEPTQKKLLKKSGGIIDDLLGNALTTSEAETSFELNFAVVKLKHTVTRKKETELEELRKINQSLEERLNRLENKI